MDESPGVSVIIPTFRRPEVLVRTLGALADIVYGGAYEVIVVDDASEPSTRVLVDRMQLEKPELRLRYVEHQHGGAAAARNRGAKEAEGEVLVFLDDDMLVQPDHLELHVGHLAGLSTRKIVNGEWEFAPEIRRQLGDTPFGRFRLWLEDWIKSRITMERLDDEVLRPSMLTACNLGIRRNSFFELGGFDESFPSAGYEDQDLAVRARRAGLDFIYDKRIRLAHVDRRVNLNEFSKRIRQGAFTAGIMARKYPDDFGAQPLIMENKPLSKNDPPHLKVKKVLKSVVATIPGRAIMRVWIATLERLRPESDLLQSAYWKWCGIWIHVGVREGLRSDD